MVGVGLIIATALSGLSTAVGTLLPGSAAAETTARIASTLLAVAVNTGLLPGALVAAAAWHLLLLIGTYL